MSLFGKIFGGKNESGAPASAETAVRDAATTSSEPEASRQVEQTRPTGSGEVVTGERARSLTTRTDNDSALPSVQISEELFAEVVVSAAPLPIPERSAGIDVPAGPGQRPPTLRTGQRHAGAGADAKPPEINRSLPSTPGESSAEAGSPKLPTPTGRDRVATPANLRTPREGAAAPPNGSVTRRERIPLTNRVAPTSAQATGARATDTANRPAAKAGDAAVSKPDRETSLRTLREAQGEHLLHVQQFAFDLDLGCAPKRWAAACKPAVAALARAAEQLQLADVLGAAQVLGAELTTLGKTGDGEFSMEARESTLRSYAALAQFADQALRPLPDRSEREQRVLGALLRGLDGVHALTFDKLSEAGALSIAGLANATASELAETTGLERALLERIVQQVAEVAGGHDRATAGEARGFLLEQVGQTLTSLERSHSRFLQTEAVDDGAGKRAARRQRDAELILLEGLLARLGELEAAQALRCGSMSQRIERMRVLMAQWSE